MNSNFFYALFFTIIAFFAMVYSFLVGILWGVALFFLLMSIGVMALLYFYGISFKILFSRLFLSRRSRWHFKQLRQLIIFFFILLLVYAISVQVGGKIELDFSREKINSLSDRGEAFVDNYNKEVCILYFYGSDKADLTLMAILRQLEKSAKISLQTVNLIEDYAFARELNVKAAGEILFFTLKKSNNQSNKKDFKNTTSLGCFGEKGWRDDLRKNWNLVNRVGFEELQPLRLAKNGQLKPSFRYEAALLKELTAIENESTSRSPLIFITAWDEEQIEKNLAVSYSYLKTLAEREGYYWKTLSLKNKEKFDFIFDKEALLIIDGSKFFPLQFFEELQNHFEDGGNLIIFLEPPDETIRDNDEQYNNGKDFLKTYNIFALSGMIVDSLNINPYYKVLSSQSLPQPRYPNFTYDVLHPITASLRSEKLPPLLIGGTGITFIDSDEKNRLVSYTSLLKTSGDSWGEKDYVEEMKKYGSPRFNIAEDEANVGSSMGLLEHSSGGKAVVFGDSDFLRNKFFHLAGNRILASNTLLWLKNNDANLAFDEKKNDIRPVRYSNKDKRIFIFLYIILMPLLLIALAIFLNWRKKNKNKLI